MNMYYCGKPGCPGHNSFSKPCEIGDYSHYKQPVLVSFILETFEGDPTDESSPIIQYKDWMIEGEDYPKPTNGGKNGHTNGNGNGHSANGNGHGNGNGHTNGNGHHNGSNGAVERNWAVEAEDHKPPATNGNSHPSVSPTKNKANLQYKLKNLRDKKQGK